MHLFSFWHLLYWPSIATNLASPPYVEGPAVIHADLSANSPGWLWAWVGSPKIFHHAERVHCLQSPWIMLLQQCKCTKISGTSRPAPWRCFISWKELGTWKHLLCYWDTLNSRINCCERGHLGKFVLLPSLFFKVLDTCTTVDFLSME